MRRLRATCNFMIAALTVLGCAGGALASDYSHDCASSDGQWKMWDESLAAANDEKQMNIPYAKVKDTVLSEKRGYCVAKGSRYEFEDKTYVRRVRFDYQGQHYEIDMLCEMIADGLPAAYTCEKEVVTLDTTGRGGDAGGSQDTASNAAIWNHNGSVMRLEATGNARVFSYENPRPGIRKAGAKKGDVVFEGTRDGKTYTGTAYIFSQNCGRVGYPAAGNVADDERGVVVEGQAPVLGDDCEANSYKHDVLKFEYVKQ